MAEIYKAPIKNKYMHTYDIDCGYVQRLTDSRRRANAFERTRDARANAARRSATMQGFRTFCAEWLAPFAIACAALPIIWAMLSVLILAF